MPAHLPLFLMTTWLLAMLPGAGDSGLVQRRLEVFVQSHRDSSRFRMRDYTLTYVQMQEFVPPRYSRAIRARSAARAAG